MQSTLLPDIRPAFPLTTPTMEVAILLELPRQSVPATSVALPIPSRLFRLTHLRRPMERLAVQKNYNTTYAYDEAGQLIEAVDGETGKTYRYTYDEMGNILTAQTYAVSTSGSEKLVDKRTYNYVDGILSGYTTKDGAQVPYQTDAMGNPTQIGSGLGGYHVSDKLLI